MSEEGVWFSEENIATIARRVAFAIGRLDVVAVDVMELSVIDDPRSYDTTATIQALRRARQELGKVRDVLGRWE